MLPGPQDGLRGVVGWFGKQCEHRLDWFHVSRRIENIRRSFFYLPRGDDRDVWCNHSRNLDSMKWMLWNDGVEMADFGMTEVKIGLFRQSLTSSEAEREKLAWVERQLGELRSYLYANREGVDDYAHAFRRGERISTAHVESTVNQLINWRMCKKKQMRWSKQGAHNLLQVKTATINDQLQQFVAAHTFTRAA